MELGAIENMNYIIRTIEENDYKYIADIIRNDLGYENSSDENVKFRLNTIRKHKEYITFVAIHEDKVVGFIGLIRGHAYEFDGEYLRVAALAVKKEYQDKGIGSKLLEKAEEYAKRIKALTIVLNSGLQRESTHKFYERSGYVKKGYSFKKTI